MTDLLIKVATEDPILPGTHNPDVPPSIEGICLQCLSKSPADRPVDAIALAAALAAAAAPYQTQSPRGSESVTDTFPRVISPVVPPAPPVPVQPSPGPSRRWLTIGLLVATVVLVCVLIVLGCHGGWDHAPPTATDRPPSETTATDRPPERFLVDETIPAPTLKEFGLKVHLTSPTIRMGPGGVHLLPSGTTMQIHLWAELDCNAVVLLIEPDGKVTRLFPNDYEEDDQLTAEKERVVPSENHAAWFKLTDQSLDTLRNKNLPEVVLSTLTLLKDKKLQQSDFESELARLLSADEKDKFIKYILFYANQGYVIRISSTKRGWADRLQVVATTGELPKLPRGDKNGGPCAEFNSDQDREKVRSILRGAGVEREKHGKVAKYELLFRGEP